MVECRRIISIALLALAGTGLLPTTVLAAPQSSQVITFGATVRPATSLRLSSSVLHVEPVPGGGPAVIATIEFQASARTRTAGEVILTVESLGDIDALAGGAAAGPVTIDFAGSDQGIVPGVLSTEAQVAGRWVGSGIRQGRLTFTLRGPGYLTGGALPLRFVLATPSVPAR